MTENVTPVMPPGICQRTIDQDFTLTLFDGPYDCVTPPHTVYALLYRGTVCWPADTSNPNCPFGAACFSIQMSCTCSGSCPCPKNRMVISCGTSFLGVACQNNCNAGPSTCSPLLLDFLITQPGPCICGISAFTPVEITITT